MQLKLDRFISNDKSTIGRLFIDDQQTCFTCEDAYHAIKIPHETRIPAGTYQVKLRALLTSHFDPEYLRRWPAMHKGMLELQDVPNYTGVLIHIGNFDTDTDGCILLGLNYSTDVGLTKDGSYSVQKSGEAYLLVYPKIATALSNGDTVTIEVQDNDRGEAMV